MSHVLVIVRHAKAEAYGTTDHERVLTDRGIEDAAAAGAWLAGRGVVPDRALVSDARRTRQTWDALAGEAGWTLEPVVDSVLYEAGSDTALDLVRAVEEDCATVVLIGHNPTMASLAQVLDVAGAPQLATTGFPPAAVAVFSYDGPWADLAEGSAQLLEVNAVHG
ncbi:histidine phosphatase family protein [Nocardioides sp. AN3]